MDEIALPMRKPRRREVVKSEANRARRIAAANAFIGRRFGRLVVVGPAKEGAAIAHSHPVGHVWWRCRCDCDGKVVERKYVRLVQGNAISCGCLKSQRLLPGAQFGRLTVIERIGKNPHGTVFYRCACECLNETSVSTDRLRAGLVVSCGCFKSEQSSERMKRLNQQRLVAAATD